MSASIEDFEIVETRIGPNCRFLVSEMMGHCHAKESWILFLKLVLKSRAPQTCWRGCVPNHHYQILISKLLRPGDCECLFVSGPSLWQWFISHCFRCSISRSLESLKDSCCSLLRSRAWNTETNPRRVDQGMLWQEEICSAFTESCRIA